MTTKIRTVADSGGDPREVAEKLRAAMGSDSPELVVWFASPKVALEPLAMALVATFPGATVIGATTAGEFTADAVTKGGVVVAAIAGDYIVRAGIGENLARDPERAVAVAMTPLGDAPTMYAHRTGILLLDALAGQGETATLLVGEALGADVPLAGGAAGDDLAMKRTVVGLGATIRSDACVVAEVSSKSPLGVGVCHGHQPLTEKVTVTKADGATVYTLDGAPAWDVWARATKGKAHVDPMTLPEDQIGAFLLRYEAGLAVGDEYKIRAPLARNADGSLAFACAVPEGAEIRIMSGEPSRQIASAIEAAKRARAHLQAEPAGALVFDCICRNLILEDGFAAAVAGMSEALGGAPIAGFETYGEIALAQGDLSGFHNTTTVVLAFPK